MIVLLEMVDERAARAGKSIRIETFERDPREIIAGKGARFAFDIATLKRVQGDAEVRKSVFDRAIATINFDLDARGFPKAARAGVLQGLPVSSRARGKFPKPTEQAVSRAFCNEHFVVVPRDSRAKGVMGARFLFRFDGQALRVPCFVGRAVFLHGTSITRWFFRGADRRAEFHDRLIVVACRAFGQQGFGEFPKSIFDRGLRRVVSNVEQAREHANNIAVEHRVVAVIRNAQNRGSGIRAEPGQGFEVVISTGHSAGKIRSNGVGRLVQIARAGVIPQSLPRLEHVVLRRIGEVANRGKPVEKPMVIGNDRIYLRLLEHELGEQNAIGVIRVPPRQVAFVLAIPRQEAGGDL